MDAFHLDAAAGRLTVHGELTIYQVADARVALLSAAEQETLTEIDLGGVTELDTAGLQLLLLAKRSCAVDGVPVRLTNHSPQVLDVLELTGLGAELDVSGAEAGS